MLVATVIRISRSSVNTRPSIDIRPPFSYQPPVFLGSRVHTAAAILIGSASCTRSLFIVYHGYLSPVARLAERSDATLDLEELVAQPVSELRCLAGERLKQTVVVRCVIERQERDESEGKQLWSCHVTDQRSPD